MIRRLMLCLSVAICCVFAACPQQYTGMSGMIHVPDAEMDSAGTARIGAHFLNKKFTPQQTFMFNGKHYHTYDAYISLTPFSWMEIGFTMTFFRKLYYNGVETHHKKDRYFSVKFQPLREKEGKWWPSVAIGANDFINSQIWKSLEVNPVDGGWNDIFRNYYVAATKHFDIRGHQIGVTLAYRYFATGRKYNHWTGVVGGITYRPAFYRPLRFILEYAGRDVNFGADCLLWKHLLIRASLQRFKYFSGGLCYVVNLF